MATRSRPADTHEKALAVNLDPLRYGTFAEIGAGQEVSRWFFRVGGAAGTIAKSISAYDMKVSDAAYGKGHRYGKRRIAPWLAGNDAGSWPASRRVGARSAASRGGTTERLATRAH